MILNILIKKTLGEARALMPFFFVFVMTKAFVFIGFILLGRVIEPSVYATIELSLSLALVGATILGLGLGGAATKMKLDLGVQAIADLFASRVAAVTLIATIGGIATYFLGNAEAALGWILLPLAAHQFSYGILLKINRRRIITSFIDISLNANVLLSAFALFCIFGIVKLNLLIILCAISAGLVALISVGILLCFREDHFEARLKMSLALGIPILLGDVAGQLITQGGRIALAVTGADLLEIGLYSAVFRTCAGLVLFHQILWTAYYTPLYKLAAKSLDRAYACICLTFSLFGFALAAILIEFSDWVFPQYVNHATTVGWLVPVVCAQVLQWIYLPMLLIRLQKAGISLQGGFVIIIWIFLMGCGLQICSTFWASSASFKAVMTAYLTCFAGVNLSLCVALHRRGEKLKLTMGAIVLGLLPIVIVSA